MGLQVSFALLVGIGTSFFHTRLLIEALGLTAVTVACIFIIASSTSVDFTMAGGGLPSDACLKHHASFQDLPLSHLVGTLAVVLLQHMVGGSVQASV